jgi:recombinational DNA repair protein (RecF pathway)
MNARNEMHDEGSGFDLGVCAACGTGVQDGIRVITGDGPLCAKCARVVCPDVVEQDEKIWREFRREPSKTDD